MAIQIVSVFLLLKVLMHNTAGSLYLDVKPTDISPGLTESLTVNCSFTFAQVSNISGIISLILSKMVVEENQLEKFQDLISINAFSPDQVNVLSQVNGSMLGHIDGNRESFLSIQWTYPGGDKAGMYRCEAHGMDNAGYPSELIQTAMVTSEQPDINQVIDMISDLQRQLDRQENLTNSLETKLGKQENMIETFLSLTKNQSDMINKQQSQVDTTQAQLDLIKYTMYNFYTSAVYKTNIYLLSKSDCLNSTVAEQTCKDYNGYIAEIDDPDEDNFVHEFLETFTGFYYVLVSGTDQDHEGVWTYTGSSRNMSYINWYSGEPDDPDNNCMIKYRDYRWQVIDFPCSLTGTGSKFLCEVNLPE